MKYSLRLSLLVILIALLAAGSVTGGQVRASSEVGTRFEGVSAAAALMRPEPTRTPTPGGEATTAGATTGRPFDLNSVFFPLLFLCLLVLALGGLYKFFRPSRR
jgi:hypothetical protein